MSVKENIEKVRHEIPRHVKLVIVTKTHSPERMMEAYVEGYKVFGENKVQELIEKQLLLPKDIEWHLIGHLQTNKVKYIVPFIHLIHSVDSLKLLQEINKQAAKHNRIVNCLLQVHIASEETKFGLSFKEAENLFFSPEVKLLNNISINGLMGMASLTENVLQIRQEFKSLFSLFHQIKNKINNPEFKFLSMGMSSDYKIAIEEGSNMIRVGSSIFGTRNYK